MRAAAPHHFAGVGLRVAQRHVAVQVHLVVVADELEDSDVEAAGERHAVLRHADGVVFDVGTAVGRTDGHLSQSALRGLH